MFSLVANYSTYNLSSIYYSVEIFPSSLKKFNMKRPSFRSCGTTPKACFEISFDEVFLLKSLLMSNIFSQTVLIAIKLKFCCNHTLICLLRT